MKTELKVVDNEVLRANIPDRNPLRGRLKEPLRETKSQGREGRNGRGGTKRTKEFIHKIVQSILKLERDFKSITMANTNGAEEMIIVATIDDICRGTKNGWRPITWRMINIAKRRIHGSI